MTEKRRNGIIAVLGAALVLYVPGLFAQVTVEPIPQVIPDVARAEMKASSGLTWTPMSAPGFPAGRLMAVVHGDPTSNRDYIIRIRLPDGYRVPVHWHPNSEHITVLTGTFQLAMGTTADWSKLRSFGPGDFIYAPGRMPHYAAAKGNTIIQLNGNGPFATNLGVPPSQ